MNSRLKALYADNPWLKEVVKSLESKVDDLQSRVTRLLSEVEDLEEAVEDAEETVVSKNGELVVANDFYAILYRRHENLRETCRQLMREKIDNAD